ncbi:hypothetical protein ABW20_dc0103964 [Dactylellina cionopaga]|nr:hypothetical protein ABW20_dc0103964 [Dactylellina cionopaga]
MFYPHPLDGKTYGTLIPYREKCLRRFSSAVREKKNWTEKIMDRSLFVKWIVQAEDQDRDLDGMLVVTWDIPEVEFIYKELVEGYKPYVEERRKNGDFLEPDVDCVWRSDQLIEDGLRKELIDAIATLENVSEDEKDWHPGSNNQVLDLVHPSLWPVIYGITINNATGKPIQVTDKFAEKPVAVSKVSENTKGEKHEDGDVPYRGTAMDVGYSEDEDEDEEKYDPAAALSKKFCWLPSEFVVSNTGEAKINSYINNLCSPEQKTLFYPILEKIFSKFIPLFNHVLADLSTEKHALTRTRGSDNHDYDHYGPYVPRLTPRKHEEVWDEILDQFENDEEVTTSLEEEASDLSGWDAYVEGGPDEGLDFYEEGNLQVWQMGSVRGCSAWEPPTITPGVQLEGKKLKVIVKMANIVLQPDNPYYKGGSWHVEAMMVSFAFLN